MFYNARWYDPQLGRFAQADTIIPLQTQGTQAWDRYAYVNNNPLKYTDPSGHQICMDTGWCGGTGTGIPYGGGLSTPSLVPIPNPPPPTNTPSPTSNTPNLSTPTLTSTTTPNAPEPYVLQDPYCVLDSSCLPENHLPTATSTPPTASTSPHDPGREPDIGDDIVQFLRDAIIDPPPNIFDPTSVKMDPLTEQTMKDSIVRTIEYLLVTRTSADPQLISRLSLTRNIYLVGAYLRNEIRFNFR